MERVCQGRKGDARVKMVVERDEGRGGEGRSLGRGKEGWGGVGGEGRRGGREAVRERGSGRGDSKEP